MKKTEKDFKLGCSLTIHFFVNLHLYYEFIYFFILFFSFAMSPPLLKPNLLYAPD